MKTKFYKTQKLALLGLLGVTATSFPSQEAYAYDMDCKVILCIAGGFPSECSDAWRYMIKRITRFPKPLPPFGFCAMSNGSEYKAHNVNYSFLGNGPQAYDCPEGKQLYYRREETDSGGSWRNETAFCYTSMTRTRNGWGRDESWQEVYHGQSVAQPINFQLNIVIEPGTDHEFKSPLFRINYNTGYVSQRPI